jgi:hypothetical protein
MAGIIISSILSLLKQAKLKDKIRSLQRDLEDLKSPPLISEEEIEETEE